MAATVDNITPLVSKLGADWPLLEALMGGTRTMRAAATTYLPKWPNEEDGAYTARLNTATLFNAYRRTVNVMAGKPFAKELTLSDDTPDDIKTWAKDIDREGVSLHVFASEMFQESFYGLAGILVEAPKQATPTGKVPSKADQKKAG